MTRDLEYPVFAIPIPEQGDASFVDFLEGYSAELGKLGGETIAWMPIDNPKKTDQAHANARSEERAVLDQQKADEFEKNSDHWGGSAHYQRMEYSKLLEIPGVDNLIKPAILFAFTDVPGKWAILNVSTEQLDSRGSRRTLGKVLLAAISGDKFFEYSHGGKFTGASVDAIQSYLYSLKLDKTPVDSIPVIEPIDVPVNTRWEDIAIQFTDGHTVRIRIDGETYIRNYTQMGMANSRNANPTKQWDLLRSFAEGHGQLTWKSPSAHAKNKKQKGELSKKLRHFFSLDGDPITYEKRGKFFQCRFGIVEE